MILSKADYQFYLEADRISLDRKVKYNLKELAIRRFVLQDHVWEFQKLLRKTEFLKNSKHDLLGLVHYGVTLREFDQMCVKLGFHINPNNFGPGLCITHTGSIVIHVAARVGANCRIHPGVVIGTSDESSGAPKLGDNIYIGPGAKIYGQIEIADNVVIGANSVVNRSFGEPGITIAGVPARRVSNRDSGGYLIKATEVLRGKLSVPRTNI